MTRVFQENLVLSEKKKNLENKKTRQGTSRNQI